MIYPRSLKQNNNPFNPLEVSKKTEKIVIDGDKRKYNLFRLEHFYGQIATARGIGCNLRCGFCWINPSRDFPEGYGKFYSPSEVYEELIKVSSSKFGRAIMSSLIRISGCEPTIGMNHLLALIEICKRKGEFEGFLLETNGILLGHDEGLVKKLNKFKDNLLVRLSFKAGTPEAFERKTGAKAEYFDFQFRALEFLKKYGLQYRLASMSSNPEIMPPEERKSLLERIISYGTENLRVLEEETADLFMITKKRLSESGIVNDIKNVKKTIYEPIITGSIARAIKTLTGEDKDYEALINLSYGELKKVFEIIEFKVIESPCATCLRKNVWHGHNTRDDLDRKLG